MTEHIDPGDRIRGRLLIYECRKVSKPQLIRLHTGHRGSRGRLEHGICWVEHPITLPEEEE